MASKNSVFPFIFHVLKGLCWTIHIYHQYFYWYRHFNNYACYEPNELISLWVHCIVDDKNRQHSTGFHNLLQSTWRRKCRNSDNFSWRRTLFYGINVLLCVNVELFWKLSTPKQFCSLPKHISCWKTIIVLARRIIYFLLMKSIIFSDLYRTWGGTWKIVGPWKYIHNMAAFIVILHSLFSYFIYK